MLLPGRTAPGTMWHRMSYEGRLPDFEDPRAQNEPYGFTTGLFDAQRLPGTTWAEGNAFRNFFLPYCNMDEGIFEDPVWSFGDPGQLYINQPSEERVLGEIFYSDAIRRLQAVEQLTLPPEYTTIPNTGAFSRFEHIWGSVLFVRQMARQQGISGREAVTLQLRTLVSDVAHTFGSHLGDWLFQGVGGAENQHDLELAQYLEATGINDTLRKYDYDPESVTFPDITDWVEAPQPDLCVDRVDYGLREMNRWNPAIRSSAFRADDFTLTADGMLAMTDQRRARIFSEGFLLLSQEHWSEPTHRFMLDMLMLRTKLFYAEGRAPRSWVFHEQGLLNLQDIHPRDLMYVTDAAQMHAYLSPQLPGHTMEAIMKGIAQYRRQYVWPGREQRIWNYMQQFCQTEQYDQVMATDKYTPLDHASFGSYQDEYPQAHPIGFAILNQAEAENTVNDFCIDLPQPPFKMRQIDPLVQSGNGFKRLSELDPSYGHRLEEHRDTLAEPKVARLAIADPAGRLLLRQTIENIEAHWQHRLNNSRRMSAEELRSLVNTSSLEIFGSYPFMIYERP